MRASFSGSGPGTQARDGCSVELYRRLPYFGELDAVREYLPYGVRVLELGCGTGRLTRKLLEWGTRPTSVDNSPKMLDPKQTVGLLRSRRSTINLIESWVIGEGREQPATFDQRITSFAHSSYTKPVLAQTRDALHGRAIAIQAGIAALDHQCGDNDRDSDDNRRKDQLI